MMNSGGLYYLRGGIAKFGMLSNRCLVCHHVPFLWTWWYLVALVVTPCSLSRHKRRRWSSMDLGVLHNEKYGQNNGEIMEKPTIHRNIAGYMTTHMICGSVWESKKNMVIKKGGPPIWYLSLFETSSFVRIVHHFTHVSTAIWWISFGKWSSLLDDHTRWLKVTIILLVIYPFPW